MESASSLSTILAPCWYCERRAYSTCLCGRTYCAEHGREECCSICGLAFGVYERAGVPEPVSGFIMLSLSAAAGDPYIVIPSALRLTKPIPLSHVEKVLGAVIKMLESEDIQVLNRAVSALAATTNSWLTMNPSALDQHKYGTSLLATDYVRRWLLHVLKLSRGRSHEAIALTILDKLRTADFRDIYPGIQSSLKSLSSSNMVTRVRAVFDTLQEFYPSFSPLVNERCELLVYEQYVSRTRGAGATMERIYGPLMKYSLPLAKMHKKGTWLSSHARYEEWYFGEEEPV